MKKVIGFFKSCFSLKASIIGCIALCFAISAISLMLTLTKYEITISDDGEVKQAFVYSKTVEDALKEAGINVSEFDELSLDLNANLRSVKQIEIKRAKVVTLAVNGQERKIRTLHSTVSELLSASGIPEDGENLLVTPGETPIAEGLRIEMVAKVYEEVVENEAIPYETVKRASYNLDKGSTRVAKVGVDGEKAVTYRVLKHNGVVYEKTAISETVVKKPQDKVVEYGVVAAQQTSRGGEVRSKRVIDCKATAYCLKGRTASGVQSQRGVVAVDPRVIPLGTRLYIESADGSFSYGYAVAGDTGSAIKGNRIDLYMDTKSECLSFGVRNVKVYILE